MYFLSTDDIRSIDEETIRGGVPGKVLMGRAARGMAEHLLLLAGSNTPPLVVVCGPGNNGGDGFALAARMRECGWPAQIWAAIPPSKVKGDPELYLRQAEEVGVPIRWMPEEHAWDEADTVLPAGAWLVDALLGTGMSDPPRKTIGRAVDFLRDRVGRHPVFAVDIPTGLDADTGEPFDDASCVKADHTLTLGSAKKGFESDVSLPWTGSVAVVDLGFDRDQLQEASGSEMRACGRAEAAEGLGHSSADEHKGSRGRVLCIGGRPGLTGAIGLASKAALRCGAGLVTVWTPRGALATVDGLHAEVMALGGAETEEGHLADQELPLSLKPDAILVGPGLGTGEESRKLVLRILREYHGPVVLDADALSVSLDSYNGSADAPRYLTPHPGELGRLMNLSAAEIQSDRAGHLQCAMNETEAYMVLKGARSRMGRSGTDPWLNLNGNPGLATGGTGDVLAGLTVALAARGVDPALVLPLAVYLHGLAGDVAACRQGTLGMVAGDVIQALPEVLRYVQGR